jgi:hypothetical protein
VNTLENLEPEEETRVEIVCYIWEKLNNYLINTLPKIAQNIGIDLEQKMTSWIMDYRRIQRKNILCLRTGDTPIVGISGIHHKIDNLMYIHEKDYTHGYLIECKSLDIESLRNFLALGDFPKIGRKTVAFVIFESFDVCPQLLFKRYFYINTKRNFCMLVTTKPLDYSALMLALSYGICVIQPDRVTYQIFVKKVEPETALFDDILKKIPIYYPPEVLLKKLSESVKASKRNISLAFKIYKHLFSKSLERISANFPQLANVFYSDLSKNKDAVEKISYLSMYLNSLNEAV